jgi:hypothetical protein
MVSHKLLLAMKTELPIFYNFKLHLFSMVAISLQWKQLSAKNGS